MRSTCHSGLLARIQRRIASILAMAAICLAGAIVTGCGSSNNVATADPGQGTGTTATGTASPALAVVKPVIDCSQLASVDMTDIGGAGSTITSATVTTATVNGNTVSLCAVKGTLAPANTFEVSLPVSTWTQRFAELGCGGLCGTLSDPTKLGNVSFSYQCPLVQEGGFVTAATDMGHTGADRTWTTDTQKQADFAYRGQHITTLAAKKLIKAYYGQEQKYAYFIGCSDGGREALMAAQRYPNDYNGIIAGAPAALFQVQNSVYHGYNMVANSTTGTSTGNVVLYADRLAILHKAVVAACADTPDGLITDPRSCHFDPASIQCAATATDTSQCLTSAEVLTAGKLYGGPVDASTSQAMQIGRPQFGSEVNWAGVEVPQATVATGSLANTVGSYNFVTGAISLIFTGTPTLPSIDTLGYTDASFYTNYLAANHPLNDATNPDLSAFKKAGGKLILWHGWSDQHISPRYTIAYYEAMQNTMGGSTVDEFARLYLVPGVAHCGGGEGLDSIDLVSQITAWTENSTAPASIMTYKLDTAGTVTASRPVYPYPAVAQYTGNGDWHDGANYKSAAALYNVRTPTWPGSTFYTPYTPTTQGVAAP
jgi:pimeloyl-ACP methyl ester carboxylesterase